MHHGSVVAKLASGYHEGGSAHKKAVIKGAMLLEAHRFGQFKLAVK